MSGLHLAKRGREHRKMDLQRDFTVASPAEFVTRFGGNRVIEKVASHSALPLPGGRVLAFRRVSLCSPCCPHPPVPPVADGALVPSASSPLGEQSPLNAAVHSCTARVTQIKTKVLFFISSGLLMSLTSLSVAWLCSPPCSQTGLPDVLPQILPLFCRSWGCLPPQPGGDKPPHPPTFSSHTPVSVPCRFSSPTTASPPSSACAPSAGGPTRCSETSVPFALWSWSPPKTSRLMQVIYKTTPGQPPCSLPRRCLGRGMLCTAWGHPLPFRATRSGNK